MGMGKGVEWPVNAGSKTKRKSEKKLRLTDVRKFNIDRIISAFGRLSGRRFLPAFLRHMKKLNIGSMSGGNRLTLIVDGDECFDRILNELRSAGKSINLETFIFSSDEIGWKVARILAKKAEKGVEVNVIYDSLGSLTTSPEIFLFLKNSGAEVLEYRPISMSPWKKYWNFGQRDHRKILVIDGKKAFVGGVNIGSDYAGRSYNGGNWRDTHLLIEGPAARDVQFIFLENWYRNGGDILDQDSHFPVIRSMDDRIVMILGSRSRKKKRPIKESYFSAIESAQEKIYITNAYFIPNAKLVRSLVRASQRGVDVRLLLPAKSDHPVVKYAGRYLYRKYLKHGIRVFEYVPSVLHAKTAVIDGIWSTVGSSNLDELSFRKNLEINAVVLDQKFGKELEMVFLADLEQSREITLNTWHRRSLIIFIIEWFFHRFRNYM